MLPLMQIAIYVGVVILGFKAVQIFQTAFVSESPNRNLGMMLGAAMILIALIIGGVAVFMTEHVASQLMDGLFNFPQKR